MDWMDKGTLSKWEIHRGLCFVFSLLCCSDIAFLLTYLRIELLSAYLPTCLPAYLLFFLH